MECNFRVGQKVVCVDASTPRLRDPRYTGHLHGLAEGQVYTVRSIARSPSWRWKELPEEENEVWVYLQEITRLPPQEADKSEVGYLHTRFRPLVTTDISIFQEMLVNPHVPVKEDA